MVVATHQETMRLDSDSIATFRAQLDGWPLTPGDDGYDERRSVWNGMIDKRPALIVVPASEADIQVSVRFAAEQGWPSPSRGRAQRGRPRRRAGCAHARHGQPPGGGG